MLERLRSDTLVVVPDFEPYALDFVLETLEGEAGCCRTGRPRGPDFLRCEYVHGCSRRIHCSHGVPPLQPRLLLQVCQIQRRLGSAGQTFSLKIPGGSVMSQYKNNNHKHAIQQGLTRLPTRNTTIQMACMGAHMLATARRRAPFFFGSKTVGVSQRILGIRDSRSPAKFNTLLAAKIPKGPYLTQ